MILRLCLPFGVLFLSGCCGWYDESLPDLLSNQEIRDKLISQGVDESIYDQSLVYLNAAVKLNKLFCSGTKCSKTENAGEHTNSLAIYYNETNPNPANWGDPKARAEVSKQPIHPCEEVSTGGKLEFLRKGYYLLEIILDASTKVTERNEGNNEKDSDFRAGRMPVKGATEIEKNLKWGNNRYTKLIYIDRDYKVKNNEVVKIVEVY